MIVKTVVPNMESSDNVEPILSLADLFMQEHLRSMLAGGCNQRPQMCKQATASDAPSEKPGTVNVNVSVHDDSRRSRTMASLTMVGT